MATHLGTVSGAADGVMWQSPLPDQTGLARPAKPTGHHPSVPVMLAKLARVGGCAAAGPTAFPCDLSQRQPPNPGRSAQDPRMPLAPCTRSAHVDGRAPQGHPYGVSSWI